MSLSTEIQTLKSTLNQQRNETQSLLQQTKHTMEQKKMKKINEITTKYNNDIEMKQKELEQIKVTLQSLQNQYDKQSNELINIQLNNDILSKENMDIIQNKEEVDMLLQQTNQKLEDVIQRSTFQEDQIEMLMDKLNQLTEKAIAEVEMEKAQQQQQQQNTKIDSQIQFTKDIIKVKSKSLKDLYDMEKKVQSFESETKRLQQLEFTIALYEEERKSLRSLVKLGLCRIWSIITFQKFLRLRRNKGQGGGQHKRTTIEDYDQENRIVF